MGAGVSRDAVRQIQDIKGGKWRLCSAPSMKSQQGLLTSTAKEANLTGLCLLMFSARCGARSGASFFFGLVSRDELDHFVRCLHERFRDIMEIEGSDLASKCIRALLADRMAAYHKCLVLQTTVVRFVADGTCH